MLVGTRPVWPPFAICGSICRSGLPTGTGTGHSVRRESRDTVPVTAGTTKVNAGLCRAENDFKLQ